MKLNTLFEGFSKQIYSKSNESSDEDSALAAASTKLLAKNENKKYRLLLDDSIEWQGHKLYRIQYKKIIVDSDDFKSARPGKLGGYIESLDNLSEKGKCVVLNNAKVWGNAKVCENAEVFGHAQVYGDAKVYGDTKVYNHAQIYGDAQVYGNPSIYDYTKVYGDAKVHNLFNKLFVVKGTSEIYGDADVCNNDGNIMIIVDKKINH